RFLAVAQSDGLAPMRYPHVLVEPVNTGFQSGYDFDGDGEPGDPGDAWGFGHYPGQYGMAVYSRFPIDREGLRTFRELRWATMPGHHMPDGRDGRPAWYSADEAAAFRLSSKSHWDVPIRVDGHALHLLASHPTPPVFDGDEDRNGRRNFDEIRLWADYLTGGEAASYLIDDQGRPGGLDPKSAFVLLGDLNADPVRGETFDGRPAIAQLLDHPRIQDPRQQSPGERAGIGRDGRPYPGDARTLTSGFGRIDYALPSTGLRVLASGVFWPPSDDPLHALVEGNDRASDHQLVWVDLAWPPDDTATDTP
ncbi:MAG: endonuclease/exonuclease/phosphatase family protein, partial [Acidobacteriota bacterium]